MKQTLILISVLYSSIIFSNNVNNINVINDTIEFTESSSAFSDTIDVRKEKIRYFSRKRFVSIALVILTGPLGGHRIYLGSHPVVPVFYALTLGGGFGILPIIDLISIIFTKDLSKFENNERVIMWLNANKEKEDEIKNR